MLPEVVSKITTLFKGTLAAWIAALEQKLGSLGNWVPNLPSLVPLLRDSLKSLGLNLLFNTAGRVHFAVFEVRVLKDVVWD